jgi:hypothetical protein
MTSQAFATIATRDHLAHVRVLAEGLRRHHAEPLYVLCVDEPQGHFDPGGEAFRVVSLADVLPAEHRGMTFFYTPFELCNALKPFLQRYIFAHTAHDRLLSLDADVFPTGPLHDGFAALDDAPILLSPHLLEPCPADLAGDIETFFLRLGTFNGGCLGLRRGPQTDRFLDWFAARTATHGFKGRNGTFVDQLWLNMVPAFFPDAATWRHPGANVANWNLHERVLQRADGGCTANGRPLLFAHMSNWRFDAPADWTLGGPGAAATDPGIVAELGIAYRDALLAAGHVESRRWPYGFGTFANGRPITPAMRHDYFDRLARGTVDGASPFEHPEWFRGPLRYVEWKRFVPLSIKRFLRDAMSGP